MSKNIIREKSFDFALRVIKLYKFLLNKKEYVLSKQLLRCGTSIGAMIRESEHAQSRADFINKMAVAQKEANEAEYWIELLYKSEYLTKQQFESIIIDIQEIKKILASIIITTKNKL